MNLTHLDPQETKHFDLKFDPKISSLVMRDDNSSNGSRPWPEKNLIWRSQKTLD